MDQSKRMTTPLHVLLLAITFCCWNLFCAPFLMVEAKDSGLDQCTKNIEGLSQSFGLLTQLTNPCFTCECSWEGMSEICKVVRKKCPAMTCSLQVVQPGSCCKKCKGCQMNGESYSNGERWNDAKDNCTTYECNVHQRKKRSGLKIWRKRSLSLPCRFCNHKLAVTIHRFPKEFIKLICFTFFLKATDLYKDQNFLMAYIYRTRDWLHEYKEQFTQPSSEVLLPDPLPAPYIQPKYTLVLELTDILVHPEYDRTSGWRFRKRPGVAAFLKALTLPMFEIVIYTHENGFSSAPVVDGLDPDGFIMYRLYRDATKYMKGTHVKDLSKLNRDITKVILVDCDARTSVLQPRNALILKKWEGDPKDTDLFELIPFFDMIAQSNVDDVRPILDFYRSEEDVVAAFRRNQEVLLKQQEELLQAQKQQKPAGGGFFSKGFFGRRT